MDSFLKLHRPRASGLVLMLATLWGAAGCHSKREVTAPPPPRVEVVAIRQQDVPIIQDWVGTLEPEVNATITAQVTGYLLSRDYQEGSRVTNGQALFRIDPRPFQATLDQARAQLTEAEARRDKFALDVKRYIPLAATEAISKQELDDAVQNEKTAQGEVEAAQAAVKQAELNLGFTTLRAPVNGVAGLASEQAQIGNLVSPASGPLTTVAQVDPMRAYFSISQKMLEEAQALGVVTGRTNQSSDGPVLEIVLASGETYPMKGRVRFSDNQVNVKTGTITMVGSFPNLEGQLVPGMFVRVRARLGTDRGALVVPQRAVTDMQGRSLVAVVDKDHKVSIRPVEVGVRVGTDWVIRGALQAGEQVVAEGIQKVRNGATVDPVPFREGTSEPGSKTPPAAGAGTGAAKP